MQNNQYTYLSNGQILAKPNIHAPAVQLFILNFSYDDKYVVANMSRIDVGTRYPTLLLLYTEGLKDIFQGDYRYHKLVVGLNYILHVNPLATPHFYVEEGKIFGAVPYPLMELHPGNETYIYDENAYNMMNYYEFASDQYTSLNVEHHFEGYFLKKIPLIRKLKWREIVGYKALYGSANRQNEQVLMFPSTLRGAESRALFRSRCWA